MSPQCCSLSIVMVLDDDIAPLRVVYSCEAEDKVCSRNSLAIFG